MIPRHPMDLFRKRLFTGCKPPRPVPRRIRRRKLEIYVF